MITKEEFENFIELNEKITTHAAKAINAWQIIKNKDFKCDFASPEDIRFEKDHFYYVYYQYGDEEYEQYESYLIEKLEDQKRKQKERDEEEKKKRKDLNKLQEAFLKKEEYENYLKLKEKYEGKK